MKTKFLEKVVVFALASLSVVAGSARADIYNIDFGYAGMPPYVGRGLLGGVDDHYWNKLTSPNQKDAPLKKSDGRAGEVTLGSSGIAGAYQSPEGNNRFGWDHFGDYWYIQKQDGAASLTLDHLPTGSTYTLLLYAMPGSEGRVVQADINGGSRQQTSGDANTWEVTTWLAAPAPASNYLKFTGSVPPNGSLTLHLSAVGSDVYGDILGLQIQTSPVTLVQPGPKVVGYGSLVKNLQHGRDQKAMFVGTSLTAGYSWPCALQAALANKYEGRMIISDRAIPSTQSTVGVQQIEAWLSEDHPDAVFIEYAINDASGSAVSLDQSRANVDAIVAAILKSNPGADIILLTMDNPEGKALEERPGIEKYYQLYRDYAATHKMTLIDDYPIWKKLYETDPIQWKIYVPDGIHPTFEGNRAVALGNMVSALEQAGSSKR